MALEMTKRVDKVKLLLKKHNIPDDLKAQVDFALDVSNSAIWMYKNGMMQELTERLMAVALRLDADGKLGLVSFGSRAHRHPDIVENMIPNFILNLFIPESKNGGSWDTGTDYAPAVSLMASNLVSTAVEKTKAFFSNMFSKKEVVYPNFKIFVSDGQNMGDDDKFVDILSKATNDYWVLVGVGDPAYFDLMENCADDLPNVGFVHFPDLSLSDDAMYEQILAKEALDWLVARQPK